MNVFSKYDVVAAVAISGPHAVQVSSRGAVKHCHGCDNVCSLPSHIAIRGALCLCRLCGDS